MSPEPIVRIGRVGKKFGAGRPVLEDITLDAKPGEFVTLIGPSGCGKSTLLRMIAGLSAPTTGRIEVEGKTPEQARDGMFFVFQDAHLLPWRRVVENVELPLFLRGEPAGPRRQRCREMLKLVGLTAAAEQHPWQLSGGMRMRVSIARALSVAPRILLLDEPFGALDEMTRDQLNEDLLRLRERDPFTAIFVTHSVAEAVFVSTRIIVLSANPGRVAEVIEVPFGYPRPAELRETTEFLKLQAATARALRAVRAAPPSS